MKLNSQKLSLCTDTEHRDIDLSITKKCRTKFDYQLVPHNKNS